MELAENVEKIKRSQGGKQAMRIERQQQTYERVKAKGLVRQQIVAVNPLDVSPSEARKSHIVPW